MKYLLTAAILVLSSVTPITGYASPQLPQNFVDVTAPSTSGTTVNLPSGGNLQQAIDNAKRGDIIVLQAGGKYQGPIILRSKAGSGWVQIITSAISSGFPSRGTRISYSDASLMPKIEAQAGDVAITTESGASYYWLRGIEIKAQDGVQSAATLFKLGDNETSLAAVPHHFVIEQSYLHGQPGINMRRGVGMNANHVAVIDSYLSDFKDNGSDSQAICGWAAQGPYLIRNNFIEGAAENVMFGGGDPVIQNVTPSDIIIERNHFYKPLSWQGSQWVVKNLLELKHANRVLVQGNIFENNWAAAQTGFGFVFKSSNQDGTAPWTHTSNVTFINNIVKNSPAFIKLCAKNCDGAVTAQGGHYLIENNLFIAPSQMSGGHNDLLITSGVPDIKFNHNTSTQLGNIITGYDGNNDNFIFTNNISAANEYGIKGDSAASGFQTLNTYFAGYSLLNNIFPGASTANYPSGNFYPASMSQVGFVNPAAGNYRLAPGSQYAGAATDGTDIGVNFNLLDAAMNGMSPTSTPTPVAPSATPTPGVTATPGNTPTNRPEPTILPTPPSGGTPDNEDGEEDSLLISNIKIKNITKSSATISWSTNFKADSMIKFRTGRSNWKTKYVKRLTMNHKLTLSGLKAGNTYTFRIYSKFNNGLSADSETRSFTTAPLRTRLRKPAPIVFEETFINQLL